MITFLRLSVAVLLVFGLYFSAGAQNQTVSNGAATTAVNFTGIGCRYSWTNNNPGIGLAASGTGNIPSFVAKNTGTTPVTATITATPVGAGYAYVPDQVNNSVSVVDLSTNTVKAKIPVGQTPVSVAVAPDGSRVYVTNLGSKTVTVITPATNSVTGTIQLVNFATYAGYVLTDLSYVPIAGNPSGMIMSPDGKKLYVANSGIAYSIVDEFGRLMANLYVIYVVDIATGSVSMISLGRNPMDLRFNHDGTLLYVSSGDSNVISVMDVKASEPARPILISGITKGSGEATLKGAGAATIIRGFVMPTNANAGANGGPRSMTLSPDGSKLYVANTNAGSVTVVNTATYTILSDIPMSQFPVYTALSPDGSKLYVTRQSANTVSVVNTADNSVMKTYGPYASSQTFSLGNMSLSADGKFLYVENGIPQQLLAINVSDTDNGATESISVPGSTGSSGSFIVPGNCSGSPVTFTITVNPSTPTISTSGTPAALSTTYGTASVPVQFSVSGNNMTAGVLVTPPPGFEVSTDNATFNKTVTVGGAGTIPSSPVYVRLAATANAGSYSGNIVLSSAGAGNVNKSVAASTISPAKLIIAVNDQTRIYGTVNTTVMLSYSGFVNGDDHTKLSSPAGVANAPTVVSPAGVYLLRASGAASANYNITYTVGTLTITPATLTIKANDQTKTFGANNPALTVTYTGFVNADNTAQLTQQPIATTTATATSPTGAYPIMVSGASSPNYNIIYVNGTLTITAAQPPVITSVSPSTAAAGTTVTITGSNLLGTTAVGFGGLPAASFTVNSSTSITAVVPVGAANGATVTTASGTNNFAGFNFVPVPQISAGGPTTIITGGQVVLTASPATGGYTYQWLKDGAEIGGATAATYTATQGGTYTVRISQNSVGQVSVGLLVTTVFGLPANNFRLTITGASCKGTANGAVSITATQRLEYTATLTRNGVSTPRDFTETAQLSDLAAGSYNLCITVKGQTGYQQCYTVVITEPKDLALYTTIEPGGKNIILSMDGGATYHIDLNGKRYSTTGSQITLPLVTGKNTLTLSTDKPCQGVISKDVTRSVGVAIYPNPVVSTLQINPGTTNMQAATVTIYDKSGAKVHTKKFGQISGIVQMDLSFLESGLYVLHLSATDQPNKIFKVIKQ